MGAEISYLHNERMHSVLFPVDNQVGHKENVIGGLSHLTKVTRLQHVSFGRRRSLSRLTQNSLKLKSSFQKLNPLSNATKRRCFYITTCKKKTIACSFHVNSQAKH